MNLTSDGSERLVTHKIVYSLADCEEGRVYNNNKFKYPDDTENKDKERNKCSDQFRWHYANETWDTTTPDKQTAFMKHQKTVITPMRKDSNMATKCPDYPPNSTFPDEHYNYSNNHRLVPEASYLETFIPKYATEDKTVNYPAKEVNSKHGQGATFLQKIRKCYNTRLGRNNNKDDAKYKQLENLQDYSNLSEQEQELLNNGMALFKNKKYEQALQQYQIGNQMNPSASEFQIYMGLCEKKIQKKEKKLAKTNKLIQNENIAVQSSSEYSDDKKDTLTPIQQNLLLQAEASFKEDEFLRCCRLCQEGLKMLPRSNIFLRVKQKAYSSLLSPLGVEHFVGNVHNDKIADNLINARQMFHQGELDRAIDVCNDIITSINDIDKSQASGIEVQELLACAYNISGSSYFSKGLHKKALSHHLHDLHIATENDLDNAKVRALMNIGKIYVKMESFEKAICIWKQLLDLDMTAEDQTSWLCHEIGQCYLKLEDYANANRYADIALQAACTHNQSAKKVEASLLAAYAAMNSGCVNSSKAAFEKALYYTEETGDVDTKASVTQALEEIDLILEEMSIEQ